MSQKVQTLQVFGGHFSHLHLPASLMATKASILAQSPPLPSPMTRVIKGSALILFLLLLIFLIHSLSYSSSLLINLSFILIVMISTTLAGRGKLAGSGQQIRW